MGVILVVEDNEENLELVTRSLRRDGHQVIHVPNGAAGVSAAEEQRMDGWKGYEQDPC
ncbi:MAG TPA: hypothetical protein VKT81_11240 [Bryobacteraceae bacterium]|nr:hypothetical protein [Bryobacteraceae bacterium]